MTKWWQKLADFLHTANLIPLVVLISTYHYYQALRSHDPLLVALPVALFVDLMHFRTVQRAVKSGEGAWKVTAVFTTLIAFGLQWIFYSQPGEGETLIWWQVILFASIVPVGLAIMAWHHQRQEQEQITDWQKLIAEAQQRAEQMQQEAAAEQARAVQMQREAEAERQRAEEMQARAAEMQSRLAEVQQEATAEHERAEQMQLEAETERERAAAMQTQLAEVQVEAGEMRSQLEQVQAEAAQMQKTLNEKQAVSRAWQTLNPEMQTLALFNAQMLTAQAAAEKLGVHVTTVRRKAKQLNGTGGQS